VPSSTSAVRLQSSSSSSSSSSSRKQQKTNSGDVKQQVSDSKAASKTTDEAEQEGSDPKARKRKNVEKNKLLGEGETTDSPLAVVDDPAFISRRLSRHRFKQEVVREKALLTKE
jgi:hypothetical protein